MPATLQFKAVLFDMDGVLIDVSRSYRRAIEETVEHFTGRDLLPGAVQRYKNHGGFNDDWKLTHAVITDTGIQVPFSRVVEEFQKRYRGENWDGFITEEPRLVKDEMLRQLCKNDCILGIVTGRPEAEARWTLDRFDWKRFFPLLVAKERQEGRGKPDPFCLQHALAILDAANRHVEPEEAVYIGDSVDDMQAARAADMWAVGVVPPYLDKEEHGELLRERGAHVICHDVDELLSLLESLRTETPLPGQPRKVG